MRPLWIKVNLPVYELQNWRKYSVTYNLNIARKLHIPITNESAHSKICKKTYAPSKDPHQPARPCQGPIISSGAQWPWIVIRQRIHRLIWVFAAYTSHFVDFAALCIKHLSRDMTKATKWVCTQWRLRSAWASTQADLSLRWAHSHLVGFVMSRLIYSFKADKVLPDCIMIKLDQHQKSGPEVTRWWVLWDLRTEILVGSGAPPAIRSSNTIVSVRKLTPYFSDYKLSLVTRKPVFGVSDRGRLKPACSATETS